MGEESVVEAQWKIFEDKIQLCFPSVEPGTLGIFCDNAGEDGGEFR